MLLDQPVDDHVRAQQERLKASGAALHYTHTKARTIAALPLLMARHAGGGRPPYLQPAGGSSAVGALGYVEAAYEIADQVEAGALPAPSHVVTTVGSGGTAAGLALGLALAGLPATVVGIVVNDALRLDTPALTRLAGRTRQAAGRPRRTDRRRPRSACRAWTAGWGPGYGHPTPESAQAIAAAAAAEGLDARPRVHVEDDGGGAGDGPRRPLRSRPGPVRPHRRAAVARWSRSTGARATTRARRRRWRRSSEALVEFAGVGAGDEGAGRGVRHRQRRAGGRRARRQRDRRRPGGGAGRAGRGPRPGRCRWLQGGADELPVADGAFDVAMSVMGVIFAPDPAAAAAEMTRVVRPGGTVALTAWTPSGPINKAGGLIFAALDLPAGKPREWGKPDWTTATLEAAGATDVRIEEAEIAFTADSPAAWWQEQADHHPVWLWARRQLGEDRWREVEAEGVATLAAANEDPAAFRTTSGYLLVAASR